MIWFAAAASLGVGALQMARSHQAEKEYRKRVQRATLEKVKSRWAEFEEVASAQKVALASQGRDPTGNAAKVLEFDAFSKTARANKYDLWASQEDMQASQNRAASQTLSFAGSAATTLWDAYDGTRTG
jgi:hypothetical protein